jgi:hypothetical protein
MGKAWARENPVRQRGGVELCFGRAQERKEREGEETDARDPIVSEEKEREGARAGGLTHVCSDGWAGYRKRKALERERREKGSFQKG